MAAKTTDMAGTSESALAEEALDEGPVISSLLPLRSAAKTAAIDTDRASALRSLRRLGSRSVQCDGLLFLCARVLRVVVDLAGVCGEWQSSGPHRSNCGEHAMEVGEIASPADDNVGALE